MCVYAEVCLCITSPQVSMKERNSYAISCSSKHHMTACSSEGWPGPPSICTWARAASPGSSLGKGPEVLGVWDRNSEQNLPHILQRWEMVCFKCLRCVRKCLKFGGQHLLWSSHQSVWQKLLQGQGYWGAGQPGSQSPNTPTLTSAMAAGPCKHHVAARAWQPFLES